MLYVLLPEGVAKTSGATVLAGIGNSTGISAFTWLGDT
jgi:hypothetical protein